MSITPSTLLTALQTAASEQPGVSEIGHVMDYPKIGVATFLVRDDEGGVLKVAIERHTKAPVKDA